MRMKVKRRGGDEEHKQVADGNDGDDGDMYKSGDKEGQGMSCACCGVLCCVVYEEVV
eukprot:CAMPEP_0184342104 /NCGR_PEP_ID=MMETSP1089-20130417/10728_1 /TAXON_ID=38269 ORGANISM="Gloeochaete wittrockiana, Strain SAG46.84" /NCGR_SAMPLE_ID=MMETSP1089 /ASSEMBLY_ACC=CAM_ASM_000445 /LENGTH=56 /DNA_ID=CAMNT_0026670789 /DNA_START=116 /DNA_END=286 /DNA_ORIENTATION=+